MNADRMVFVPIVLSVGLLLSLATLLRDAVHRLRGHQWLERRATLDARMQADWVRDGSFDGTDHLGRRHRVTYAVIGVAFLGLATYLVVGSYGNYIGWTGWVSTIGWIWLAYWLFIIAFTYVGACALAIALLWRSPPTWTRPVFAHTPLASVEIRHRPPRPRPDRKRPTRRPLGPHHVDERMAAVARSVAAVWTMVAVVVFTLLAFEDRIPQAPDPGILETAVSGPVQIGLLALLTIGSILCGRNEAIGAAIMAGAAAILAFMSAVQYPAWIAVAVAFILGTPAFLHWLAWQRDHHAHHLVALATGTALIIAGLGLAADRLYDTVLGPVHPESATVIAAHPGLRWVWTGGTTARSTSVVAGLDHGERSARLVVHDSQGANGPAVATVAGQPVEGDIVRFTVEGLQPGRRYSYRIELDGQAGPVDGGFRTFPEGASSFTIAFGSCSRTGSTGKVFDAIAAEDPLLYLAVGDLNYGNVRDDELGRFLRAYAATLEAPSQAALYRATSVGYVWDDHDYGANDADSTAPSRPAAEKAYRLAVPHYSLPGLPPADAAIYQSFAVGRVRVILTDLRSHRESDEEGNGTTMMGTVQLAWFERELEAAAASGQAVVWASSSPWIEPETATGDGWGAFHAERRHIAEVVKRLRLSDRLVMLGGDAHMAAFDDGTHSAYAGEGSGFPVVHAGALDRPGGTKGGPYVDGPYPGAGQYGTLRVHDDGGAELRIDVAGRTWDGRDLFTREVRLRVS